MRSKFSKSQHGEGQRIAEEIAKVRPLIHPDLFASETKILASALRIFGGTLEVLSSPTQQPPATNPIVSHEKHYDFTELRSRLEKMDSRD